MVLADLKWLGIDWDEGMRPHQNQGQHTAASV